jgi:hypothetical protein
MEPDIFSPAWWNERAKEAGLLDKATIERLTGRTYDTVPTYPNEPPPPQGSGEITPWYLRVVNEAPGFKSSGLLLTYVGTDAFRITDATWQPDSQAFRDAPSSARFVSPVGYVAPGSNDPTGYNPVLSPVFTPPPDPIVNSGLIPPGASVPPPLLVTVPSDGITPTGLPVTGDNGLATQSTTSPGVGSWNPATQVTVGQAPSAGSSGSAGSAGSAGSGGTLASRTEVVFALAALALFVWWSSRDGRK